MKKLRTIFLVLIAATFAVEITAQENSTSHEVNIEVPEVALIGLVADNSTDIDFSTSSPVKAGSAVNFTNTKQHQNIWLNYSSIIRNQNHERKIVAFIQGEIPEGVQLIVEASEFEGSGKGKLGRSKGMITLSNQPTEIISDIGSCYTGKGENNGHYLSYKIKYDESANFYASLNSGQNSVQVVYTLTDNN